jgi:hypothetical protein
MRTPYWKIEHINSTETVGAVRIKEFLRRQLHFEAEKWKISGNKVRLDMKFCKKL